MFSFPTIHYFLNYICSRLLPCYLAFTWITTLLLFLHIFQIFNLQFRANSSKKFCKLLEMYLNHNFTSAKLCLFSCVSFSLFSSVTKTIFKIIGKFQPGILKSQIVSDWWTIWIWTKKISNVPLCRQTAIWKTGHFWKQDIHNENIRAAFAGQCLPRAWHSPHSDTQSCWLDRSCWCFTISHKSCLRVSVLHLIFQKQVLTHQSSCLLHRKLLPHRFQGSEHKMTYVSNPSSFLRYPSLHRQMYPGFPFWPSDGA